MNDEKITLYLLNEMEPAERAEFERAIAADEDLRAEVESIRLALADTAAWLNEPAPGAERAATLTVPRLLQTEAIVIPVPRRKLFLQAAAAAAIFLVGYFVGAERTADQEALPAELTEKTIPEQEPAINTPAPASDAALAQATSPARHIAEEDGRIVVRTPGAVWFVDPKFEISDL